MWNYFFFNSSVISSFSLKNVDEITIIECYHCQFLTLFWLRKKVPSFLALFLTRDMLFFAYFLSFHSCYTHSTERLYSVLFNVQNCLSISQRIWLPIKEYNITLDTRYTATVCVTLLYWHSRVVLHAIPHHYVPLYEVHVQNAHSLSINLYEVNVRYESTSHLFGAARNLFSFFWLDRRLILRLQIASHILGFSFIYFCLLPINSYIYFPRTSNCHVKHCPAVSYSVWWDVTWYEERHIWNNLIRLFQVRWCSCTYI